MNPIAYFVFQFVWFTLAWSLIARFVVWPWAQKLEVRHQLAVWVAPEMFRVLGVGLLVQNLAPDMPLAFALPTAIADTTTSVLAVLAFVGLQQNWSKARALVWACTIVGVGDLLIAFPHAAQTGAITHLATQWYVPVFAGPVMVVAHVACIITLLRTR